MKTTVDVTQVSKQTERKSRGARAGVIVVVVAHTHTQTVWKNRVNEVKSGLTDKRVGTGEATITPKRCVRGWEVRIVLCVWFIETYHTPRRRTSCYGVLYSHTRVQYRALSVCVTLVNNAA